MFDQLFLWMIGGLLLGTCIVAYWGWQSYKYEHKDDYRPPQMP